MTNMYETFRTTFSYREKSLINRVIDEVNQPLYWALGGRKVDVVQVSNQANFTTRQEPSLAIKILGGVITAIAFPFFLITASLKLATQNTQHYDSYHTFQVMTRQAQEAVKKKDTLVLKAAKKTEEHRRKHTRAYLEPFPDFETWKKGRSSSSFLKHALHHRIDENQEKKYELDKERHECKNKLLKKQHHFHLQTNVGDAFNMLFNAVELSEKQTKEGDMSLLQEKAISNLGKAYQEVLVLDPNCQAPAYIYQGEVNPLSKAVNEDLAIIQSKCHKQKDLLSALVLEKGYREYAETLQKKQEGAIAALKACDSQEVRNQMKLLGRKLSIGDKKVSVNSLCDLQTKLIQELVKEELAHTEDAARSLAIAKKLVDKLPNEDERLRSFKEAMNEYRQSLNHAGRLTLAKASQELLKDLSSTDEMQAVA